MVKRFRLQEQQMEKIAKHILNIFKISLTVICFIVLILIAIVIGFSIFDDTEKNCMEKCLAEGHEAIDCSNNWCDFPI